MKFGQLYMTLFNRNGYLLSVLFILILSVSAFGQIANRNPEELMNIDVDEKLGDQVPGDIQLINALGQTFTLDSLYHRDKPILLVMAYYNCPMLCTLVLNGVVEGLRPVSLSPGRDYYVLVVSIDPNETPQLAKAKQQNYVASMDKEGARNGMIFTVAQEEQSRSLADAIGFKYYYVEERKEWAHPAVVTLLSPEGVISRYLYGIAFKPNDLKLGLLEASQGKIGSAVDKVLLYCFHYDPDSKGYVVFATNVMKVAGIATVVILLIFLGLLWGKETVKKVGKN
ncbi:SCO family protein [candidate division KSB1 bacterium]|nr:SCO family protein [candidate division KSB1 bacterium]